ncbi:MAG: c-type cytochrome [Burkholderiaceae bacterium]
MNPYRLPKLPLLRWLCWLVFVVLAQAARDAAAAPANVQANAQAALLYHNYCSVCHGDKGDGKSRASGTFSTPPRDFTSAAARRELTRESIAATIAHGRPGTAMVGWKTQLSEADIGALADHVFTQFVQRDAAAASKGRSVYERNCAVCHGDQGAGSVWANSNMARPPRNFAAPEAQKLTRETMIAAVTHGKSGTPMAGFAGRLSSEEIGGVVDYIRSALMGAPISGTRAHGGREADAVAAPVKVDMTTGFPTGLKGDVKRGGVFYLANCATCHGARGDGAGPRAYFINPKPRNFIEAASRAQFNRVALFTAVSEGRLGSEMPAWNKVASAQQIADVAEYVFQTFVLPRAQGAPVAQSTSKR